MSVSLATLITRVATAVRDPDFATFTSDEVIDLINVAISEVGAIAPDFFQEDIAPVADTLTYILRSDEFGGIAIPEIEVVRIEVWDGTTTPASPIRVMQAASGEFANSSETGWFNWGGTLYVNTAFLALLKGHEDDYVIRVWGYSPYVQLDVENNTTSSMSDAVAWAVVARCEVEAIQRLLADRQLYTQWQTRSGNTDVSPAALMNALNIAQNDWRRRSHAIERLRSRV